MASGPLGVPLQKTASVGPGWGTSQSLKVWRAFYGQQCFVLLFADISVQSVKGRSADWLHHTLV